MPTISLRSRIGFRFITLERTSSTNDYLRKHCKELCAPFTLACAEYQSEGRGATGAWQSERGENLLFSLLTHPHTVEAKDIFLLSQVACLAVCKALETLHEGFRVKWPNDILCGGRKVAGILIENELQGKCVADCVTGIGVNVNQTSFPDLPDATSLALITGRTVDRTQVLESILDEFSRLYSTLCDAGYEDIRHSYLKRLYRMGERHAFKDSAGEFMATLETVEPTGRIVLRDDDGHARRYAFKEVQFINLTQ